MSESPAPSSMFRKHAALTIVALILAWLALDDLTTDASTNFWPERVALAACGAWLLFVAWRVLRASGR